jgi:HK97 family phage prohead protease
MSTRRDTDDLSDADDVVEDRELLDLRAEAVGNHVRTFTFDAEFAIRSGGDGRTVEGYAVVWDELAEVLDFEGHYMETFRKGSFGRFLKSKRSLPVFFNHGMTMYRTPSTRFEVPIGRSVELTENKRGLFTVSRYAKTEAADEVLQLINDDVVRAQSVQFKRTPSGGGTRRTERADKKSGLDLVERLDVQPVEFGPTPAPAYHGAALTKVRTSFLAEQISGLSAEERAELAELIRSASDADPSTPAVDEPETEPAGSDPALDPLALRHAQLRTRQKGTK